MQFRTDQIARLAGSGWATCPSVAAHVERSGLPAIDTDYLEKAFTDEQWERAEAAVAALRQHFTLARFADEVEWGVLLVPDPALLDTRRRMPSIVRTDQFGFESSDVFDGRLSAGRIALAATQPWSMVATVTGTYGISTGSYDHVADADPSQFRVHGHDTRRLMTRQVWGARVLQCGAALPDCDENASWTFTLFVAERLVDGLAESGTVLGGNVRFRLGKADRRVSSARVAPGIALR